MRIAVEAPNNSPINPILANPIKPVPIQITTTPNRRPLISGGAAEYISVLCMVVKPAHIKPTINKVIQGNNKIFLLSHFGRPKGTYNKKLSLKFMCSDLAEEFKLEKIHFIKEIKSQAISETINDISFGDVCLLENIRFYKKEEINDLNFAKELAKNFDVYINDAFSASHRHHASIVGITKYLPSVAGDSLLEEINNIEIFFNNPRKPNTAILGGSKISTKTKLIHNLIEYFDNIIIGGAMANTFLLVKGFNVGKSLVEKELKETTNKILKKAINHNCNIILPTDVVCSNDMNDSINIRHSDIDDIWSDQMILDIGNKTIQVIKKTLLSSNMILWNGPLGAFEYKPFNYGTIQIANIIKENAKLRNFITLAGGGDTISAIKMAKAEEGFTYISNAGGAFLEWLEGKESPGIKALKENKFY